MFRHHCLIVFIRHKLCWEKRDVTRLSLAYCTNESPEPSLLSKCSLLTSDATLVSLFRTGAAPLPCPIKGPLEFTYSQGEGECNSPRSRAEACTQESRLLLRYQACANVHSSESVGQYSLSMILLTALLYSANKLTWQNSFRVKALSVDRGAISNNYLLELRKIYHFLFEWKYTRGNYYRCNLKWKYIFERL